MSKSTDSTIPCPREGCAYRAKDEKRLTSHLKRFHDDLERNERREALLERRSTHETKIVVDNR